MRDGRERGEMGMGGGREGRWVGGGREERRVGGGREGTQGSVVG